MIEEEEKIAYESQVLLERDFSLRSKPGQSTQGTITSVSLNYNSFAEDQNSEIDILMPEGVVDTSHGLTEQQVKLAQNLV